MSENYLKPGRKSPTSKESYSTYPDTMSRERAPYQARLGQRKTQGVSYSTISPIHHYPRQGHRQGCEGCLKHCVFCFKPCHKHRPPCSHPLWEKIYVTPLHSSDDALFTCHFCQKKFTANTADIFLNHVKSCARQHPTYDST